MFLFCLVFAMSLCASVYMCFVVTCWERADLLALVCGVYCEFVTFPIGILGQVWYLIVSIPDLCTLTYFVAHLFGTFVTGYSKTCVKGPLSKRPKIGFQDHLSLNADQKYCRCSEGSILQYVRPSLNYDLSLRSLFCLFLSGRFTQVCIY